MDICNPRGAAYALPAFESPVSSLAEEPHVIAQREHLRRKRYGFLLLILPVTLALRDFEPPPPVPTITTRQDDIIEGFVNVRLSHFHAPHYGTTFPMRYILNRAYVNGEEPPLVIFVGGEWAISPGWVQGGLAHELAEALGAGLIYTEHRYYGETRPGSDTSTENLRWLTVDQALADLAQFIEVARSDDFQGGIFKNAKVVLVGCSYAGSMATWMRLAYPHLVTAAFSDSGPLHAQVDFPEYLELITEAIRVQGGQQCVDSIREGVEGLKTLVQSSPALVSSMFNTCSQLQSSSILDQSTFYWFGITETFAHLVQSASPGDIAAACQVLTDASVSNPTQRLANYVTSDPWTQPCIESRYSEVLAHHTNTSYDAPQTSMRLWTYQTCVEFGWYQTTSGSEQVFGDIVPLQYFHQMCRDFFSAYFDESRTDFGVERTNTLFGALTHLPDYTVSVQGAHDPWSPVGPNVTHQSQKAPVYIVPESSHCRAIYAVGSTDIEELEQVKVNVINHLHQWVTGSLLYLSAADGVKASVMVLLTAVLANLL